MEPELELKLEIDLFNHAMKGDWKKVVEIYRQYPKVHASRITKSTDTALHLAVSDGQEDYVRLLVAIIRDVENKRAGEQPQPLAQAPAPTPAALRVENEKGNTPLHLAAALGSFEMCYCIASKYPDLIGIRNKEQKNPLFIAAQYGKKDVFLCLDNILSDKYKDKDKRKSYYRGSNGDSFLHAAMNGEYFDLAFQIICRYEDLFNYFNEKGLTPLHILASKPSSFKSGSRLSPFDKIIYHCTHVDELKEHDVKEKIEEEEKKVKELEQELKKEMDPEKKLDVELIRKPKLKLPENYKTCVDIFGLVRTVVGVLLPKKEDLLIRKKKEDPQEEPDMESQVQAHDVFPANYKCCVNIVKFIYKAVLIILGSGIKKVQDKKHQHIYTGQILNKFNPNMSQFGYDDNGMKPHGRTPLHHREGISETTPPTTPAPQNYSYATEINQKKEDDGETKEAIDLDAFKNETPLLVAVKYGVMEIVKKVLELFPVAIHDVNSDGKNIVLLAVENRQPHVYQFLLDMKFMKDSIFSKVDKDGNSAVHLAAKIEEYRPWLIPGAALQMQWEIKWYEFIRDSMPISFWTRYNKQRQTPYEMFIKNHDNLVKDDKLWLMKTSESCTIAATLIATVAFATSASIPGGFDQNHGEPLLKQQGMFDVFSISSLAALCFSITALILFIAILTTQHVAMDFRRKLPWMLLMGLSTLFLSIASMLASFCGGHFFILKGVLRDARLVEYLMVLLPMAIFARVQFPLYLNLFLAVIKKVPERGYITNTF